jgi:hypothetical protein
LYGCETWSLTLREERKLSFFYFYRCTVHFEDSLIITHQHMRIVTLDIKEMYVNLPVKGIIKTAQFWFNKHNNNSKEINEQLV